MHSGTRVAGVNPLFDARQGKATGTPMAVKENKRVKHHKQGKVGEL